jgi:RNA polymerase sigma-70 factor (ECF subfamily)
VIIQQHLPNNGTSGQSSGTVDLARIRTQAIGYVVRHWPALRREAEDVVQDAIAGVLEKYPNPPPEEFRRILFVAVKNKARDTWRRSKTRQRVLGREGELLEAIPSETAPPDAVTEWADERTKLHRRLDCLGERTREIMQLHWDEGLDAATIAERTGLSYDNVRQILSRALRKLRSESQSE